MFKVNLFNKISMLLIIIGSINWGFIALVNINIIEILSFDIKIIERIVYVLFFGGAIDITCLFYKLLSLNKNSI